MADMAEAPDYHEETVSGPVFTTDYGGMMTHSGESSAGTNLAMYSGIADISYFESYTTAMGPSHQTAEGHQQVPRTETNAAETMDEGPGYDTTVNLQAAMSETAAGMAAASDVSMMPGVYRDMSEMKCTTSKNGGEEGDKDEEEDTGTEEDEEEDEGTFTSTGAWRNKEGKGRNEVRKEKYCKKMGRYFVPYSCEHTIEHASYVDAHKVVMGPATLMDLSNERLFEYIQKSQSFKVKFRKGADGETFKGCLELNFKTVEEARESQRAIEELQMREDMDIVHPHAEGDEPIDIGHIRRHGDPFAGMKETLHDRSLVVVGLTPDVTEKEIAQHFPKAVQVYIPHSFVKDERKSHGYVEFASKEDVLERVGKPILINGNYFKTFKVEFSASPETLIERIDKEKVEIFLTEALSDRRHDIIRGYLPLCYHYLDADYLDEQMRKEIKKRIKLIRHTLNASRRLKIEEKRDKIIQKQQKGNRSKKTSGRGKGRGGGKRGDQEGAGGGMDETAVNLLKGISNMLQRGRSGRGSRGRGAFRGRGGHFGGDYEEGYRGGFKRGGGFRGIHRGPYKGGFGSERGWRGGGPGW